MMITGRVIEDTQMSRPPRHRLTFSPEIKAPQNEKIEAWEWVRMSELIPCLNSLGGKLAIPPTWTVQNVMKHFVLLNKRVRGQGFCTWATPNCLCIHESIIPSIVQAGTVYIPSVWADLTVEMIGQGIVDVGVCMDPNDLVARFSDGTSAWLHWKGGNRYEVVNETRRRVPASEPFVPYPRS